HMSRGPVASPVHPIEVAANGAAIHTRLDLNESPYALPEDISSELARHLAAIPLNRYPDRAAAELTRLLAKHFGVGERQLVLGNGSAELIGLLVRPFARARHPAGRPRVLVAAPSFPGFRSIATAHGAEVVTFVLGPEFEPSEANLAEAVTATRPDLV